MTRSLVVVIVLTVWGYAQATSQSRVYSQKSMKDGQRYHRVLIALDSSTILSFVTNHKMFTINASKGTASEVDFDDVSLEAGVVVQNINGRYLGLGGASNIAFEIEAEGNAKRLPPPPDVNWGVPIKSFPGPENGPVFISDGNIHNQWISIDGGDSWMADSTLGRVATSQYTGIPGHHLLNEILPKYWASMEATTGAGWRYTPLKGQLKGQNEWVVLSRADTMFWAEPLPAVWPRRMVLYSGLIGDTAAVRIDSMSIAGGLKPLDPIRMLPLEDGALLYIDSKGWTSIYDQGVMSPFSFTFTNEGSVPPNVNDPQGGWTYVTTTTDLGKTVYRIHLTNPPTIDSLVLPAGMETKSLRYPEATLRGVGCQHEESEFSQHLVRVQFGETVATGSLTTSIDILPFRSMLYSWLNASDTVMVVTELEQLLCVDSLRRGLVRRGKVYLSDKVFYDVSQQLFYPSRNYREWGLSVPALEAGGLVFAGPVVRQISLDGRQTDTIYNAPNSFASVLSDGRLATGWKNTFRWHFNGTTDTVDLVIPDGAVADSMGYPSAMTRCLDGTLVASVQGTWREDSSADGRRQFRWGGLLRSTDDGQTWQPCELPDPESNYVMSVRTTPSGTLIATSMRMIEDSTNAYPGPGLGAKESTYGASRINVIRSTNNGVTWRQVATPFYNGPWQLTSGNINQASDGRLYVALTSGILTSMDDGQSWQLDERISSTIVPVSLTLNTHGTMLISALDGVYLIDQITGVIESPESVVARHRYPQRITTRAALTEELARGTVESAEVVDLQGRHTVLKTNGHAVGNINQLVCPAIYGLLVNGMREVVLVQE